jgi:hypothetical protein
MWIKQEQYYWRVIIAFGITLFSLNSVLFIFLGQANADEGWYLYASKLVYAGQYPYQDFAYTQTPLLPYIYGITQNLFSQSIYFGRVTSVIFSTFAYILSLIVARNHGGKMASGITSLLGATFTFGIYYQSITKTYALTTFFFILAILALSSNFKQDLKVILSTIFVLLATLTRLSALFFALPFIVYAFITSNAKYKLIMVAICLVALSWFLALALPNIDAAEWGLLTHHSSQWGNISIAGRITQIIDFRIPLLFFTFPSYFILWVTLFIMGYNHLKIYIKHYFTVFIAIAGLFFFAITNLLSGGFYAEYFVPIIFISFPISSIAYTKIFHRQKKYSKTVMNVVLLSTLVLGLIRGGFYLIDISGGHAPVDEIRNVSTIISENSTTRDRIFVLEALWLAIESNREVMPNMTMAQFSFYDTDTKTANHLHLINGQIALSYIENSIPKIIILTELDWGILRNTSFYEDIVASLGKNYRLIYSDTNFGQNSSHIEVYVRRTDK